jgi:hypothetical protein
MTFLERKLIWWSLNEATRRGLLAATMERMLGGYYYYMGALGGYGYCKGAEVAIITIKGPLSGSYHHHKGP